MNDRKENTRFFRVVLCLLTGVWLTLVGCGPSNDTDAGVDANVGGEAGPVPDASPPPVATQVRFDLGAAPMDFGAIPFPDDLYRNETGGVELGNFARGSALANYMTEVQRDLRTMDGFSLHASQFFYFPANSVDASSLPADTTASTADGASVFMMDVDPTSPTVGSRHPIIVHWQGDVVAADGGTQGQLALRPADGFPLVPGRQYSVVVTSSVLDVEGNAISTNPRFEAIRDATEAPSDALEARAYAQYAPVLDLLAMNGVMRAQVAAMSVFTVMTLGTDVAAGRAAIYNLDAPVARLYATSAHAADPQYRPVQVSASNTSAVAGTRGDIDVYLGTPTANLQGMDNPGGIMHSNIGAVVHGHFMAPRFDADRPAGHGLLERDPANADLLRVKFMDEVPFLLATPNVAGPWPLVIVQHGVGIDRTIVLTFADTMASHGFATLGINVPHHGMRAEGQMDNISYFRSASEVRHAWGTPGDPSWPMDGAFMAPDGFADIGGDAILTSFFAITDFESGLPPTSMSYVRNAFLQSTFDIMSEVRLAREGDWSEVRTALGMSESEFGFTTDAFGMVAISLGGMIGGVAAAYEPEIGYAVMNQTGGFFMNMIEQSAAYETYLTLFLPAYGVSLNTLERPPNMAIFLPELSVLQTLLDRGDHASHAQVLANREIDLLYTSAAQDATFALSTTGVLARAVGAELVNTDESTVSLTAADLPLSNNVMVGSTPVTRALYRFATGQHRAAEFQRATNSYVTPISFPHERLPEPTLIENPTGAAVEVITEFLRTAHGGTAVVSAPSTP